MIVTKESLKQNDLNSIQEEFSAYTIENLRIRRLPCEEIYPGRIKTRSGEKCWIIDLVDYQSFPREYKVRLLQEASGEKKKNHIGKSKENHSENGYSLKQETWTDNLPHLIDETIIQ